MNKHLIVLIIAVLLICVGLSGCTESQDDTSKFIGTWLLSSDENVILIFHSDENFEYLGGDVWGTWNISNGNLIMDTIDNSSGYYQEFTLEFNYQFSNSYNTLAIWPEIDEDELPEGFVISSMTFIKQQGD
jgi:hypothetical protein